MDRAEVVDCDHNWVMDEYTMYYQWVCTKCKAIALDEESEEPG